MDKNIVTIIPLENLIIENLHFKRKRYLVTYDIKELIKVKALEFFIADIGKPIIKLSGTTTFEFLKNKKENIVQNIDKIRLDEFPGGFAYIASEWEDNLGSKVILFEKYH